MRPPLQLPPPLLRPDILLQRSGVLRRQLPIALRRPCTTSTTANITSGHSVFEQPGTERVGKQQHARADGGAVAAVLALATAGGDLLGEVPQAAGGEQGAGGGVARRGPLGREAQAGRHFGVLGLDRVEDAFFLEALEGVLERLFFG